MPAEPAPCDHCWHSTGESIRAGDGRSGQDSSRCCYCGKVAYRAWVTKEGMIDGHGPHVTRRVKVFIEES